MNEGEDKEVCNEAGYEGKDKSVKPTQKVGIFILIVIRHQWRISRTMTESRDHVGYSRWKY